MDQKNLLQSRRGALNPEQQFPLVCMATEFIQCHDFGTQPHGIAKNRNLALSFHDFAA